MALSAREFLLDRRNPAKRHGSAECGGPLIKARCASHLLPAQEQNGHGETSSHQMATSSSGMHSPSHPDESSCEALAASKSKSRDNLDTLRRPLRSIALPFWASRMNSRSCESSVTANLHFGWPAVGEMSRFLPSAFRESRQERFAVSIVGPWSRVRNGARRWLFSLPGD